MNLVLAKLISFYQLYVRPNPFPIALFSIFFIFSILGISGSSQGIYDIKAGINSSDTVLNNPRSIRSDEWLFQTQSLYVQDGADYPIVNNHVGDGQDMSLINDVPVKSIFTIFKPQNLAFFFTNFDTAFAIRWWSMSLFLCLSFYLCMNLLFSGYKKEIVIVSLILLYNPFIQWWYQSITLLSISFALLFIYFFIKLFSSQQNYIKLLLYSVAFIYFSICFIFILYPSFQIPVAIASFGLVSGFLYHRYIIEKIKFNTDLKTLFSLLFSIVCIVLIFFIFYSGHSTAINAAKNSEYPGDRNISSGEYTHSSNNDTFISKYAVKRFFSSPILGNLQNDEKASKLNLNQSEASTFIFVNLVITPIILFHLLRKPRKLRTQNENIFIILSMFVGLFVIRFFTPLFNRPFEFILMNKTLNERAEIGLIVLCCVQLVILASLKIKSLSKKQSAITACVGVLLFGYSSIKLVDSYPGFSSLLHVVVACAVVGLSIYLILLPRYVKIGLLILLSLNIANTVFIHPFYTSSKSMFISESSTFIKENYNNSKKWAVLDVTLYESIPSIAGKPSISGVYTYPQLDLWQKLDPDKKELESYNRFAHTVMSSTPLPQNRNFYSPQPDALVVRFTCKNAALLDVTYLLSPTELNESDYPCLKKSNEISFPKVTLTIYEMFTPKTN